MTSDDFYALMQRLRIRHDRKNNYLFLDHKDHTGGIYTADFLSFIGSISVADFAIKPITISKIVLKPMGKRKVKEEVRAIQTICAIHGIGVTGVY